MAKKMNFRNDMKEAKMPEVNAEDTERLPTEKGYTRTKRKLKGTRNNEQTLRQMMNQQSEMLEAMEKIIAQKNIVDQEIGKDNGKDTYRYQDHHLEGHDITHYLSGYAVFIALCHRCGKDRNE